MNKKAQVSMLQTFILGIVGIGVVLAVGLIVLAELQTAAAPASYYEDVLTSQPTSTSFNGMLLNTNVCNMSVSDTLTRVASVDKITPTANFTRTIAENLTALNGSSNQLTYKLAIVNQIIIYNATDSGTPLDAGNYTYSPTAGTILWGFTGDEVAKWNNTMVYIHYNKTFVKDTTDLLTLTTYCNAGRTTTCTLAGHYNYTLLTYSSASCLKITNTNLNNSNWAVTYSEVTNTLNQPSSYGSNATGTIITKLATVPTWVGIIIVVALAFIVLGFFYTRAD